MLADMSIRHLAQMNTARLRAPLDDPSMAEFVDGLALMNALADRSPGFVWRLAGEHSDGTFAVPEDPTTIFTLSALVCSDCTKERSILSLSNRRLRR